jgi:hypothetical protein
MEVAASGKIHEVLLESDELVDEVDITEKQLTPPALMEVRRAIAFSMPSQYELESERKSSAPIIERRKQLTRVVASAVGVAWFICLMAIGESALRAMIASLH